MIWGRNGKEPLAPSPVEVLGFPHRDVKGLKMPPKPKAPEPLPYSLGAPVVPESKVGDIDHNPHNDDVTVTAEAEADVQLDLGI